MQDGKSMGIETGYWKNALRFVARMKEDWRWAQDGSRARGQISKYGMMCVAGILAIW